MFDPQSIYCVQCEPKGLSHTYSIHTFNFASLKNLYLVETIKKAYNRSPVYCESEQNYNITSNVWWNQLVDPVEVMGVPK